MADLAIITPPALGHPRLHKVNGDGMSPTFDKGAQLVVVPTTTWAGEGLYVLADALGSSVYRVQSLGPNGLRLSNDNPAYPAQRISMEQFLEDVTARVVASLQIIDPRAQAWFEPA